MVGAIGVLVEHTRHRLVFAGCALTAALGFFGLHRIELAIWE